MPEGVEHLSISTIEQSIELVIFPVMPEGVEHRLSAGVFGEKKRVIFPVMPEGVEHWNSKQTRPKYFPRDFSCDAGRR